MRGTHRMREDSCAGGVSGTVKGTEQTLVEVIKVQTGRPGTRNFNTAEEIWNIHSGKCQEEATKNDLKNTERQGRTHRRVHQSPLRLPGLGSMFANSSKWGLSRFKLAGSPVRWRAIVSS